MRRDRDNGWTGGAYSLWRACLGAAVAVAFAWRWRELGPWISGAGVIASVALALGASPRTAAFALVVLFMGLCVRDAIPGEPQRAASGLIGFALLLALAATAPRAPIGSIDALRGSAAPVRWRVPPGHRKATWLAWSCLHAPHFLGFFFLAGFLGLKHAWEWHVVALAIALTALLVWRRSRPWMLAVATSVDAVWLALGPTREIALAALLADLLLLEPGWFPGRAARAPLAVFYDGTCGLCHGFVRFVLAEDRSAGAFRFAPLHGKSFAAAASAELRAYLPDSLVVRADDGELLVRSRAVNRVLEHLGGPWRALGVAARALPRALADRLYDAVARRRRRWLTKPTAACPLVPAEMQGRFDP